MEEERWNRRAEILVVGTGFAGLCAALEASFAGRDVLLLEKSHRPGGNSIIAHGGINAVDERRQKCQGIEDSLNLHLQQTLEAGDNLGDPQKAQYLVHHALQDCIQWLEGLAVSFPNEVLWGYGAMWARTHLGCKYKQYQRGAAIVMALLDAVKRQDIEILYHHKVVEILRQNYLAGEVEGVVVQKNGSLERIEATRGVILATGGFAANTALVAKHDIRLANLETTNYKGALGEGIRLAQNIGADTIHMDYIQASISAAKKNTKAYSFAISSRSPLWSENAPLPTKIFINKEGERFVNESARRSEICHAMLRQRPFKTLPTQEAGTIEDLEALLFIPKGALRKTVEMYNQFCQEKKDKDFAKHPLNLKPLKEGPFIAESIAPANHYTMGGLHTKLTGEVIDRQGEIIPKLYAAGEVTGGLHGSNRVGHNATPECILFGRLCGKKASGKHF